MAKNPYDYENRDGVHPVSWNEFHGLCKGLVVAMSSFNPEFIVPIGRAGYYPGTLIAHLLQAELHPIRLSRRVNDLVAYEAPQWLLEPPAIVENHRVLIVDEICSTGETITIARRKLESMGVSGLRSAVLYSHRVAASIPDYIGLISDDLILNPWDREIWRNGTFQVHPEYLEALKLQGLSAGSLPALSIAGEIPAAKPGPSRGPVREP
jgi:hypothetical protein